MFLRWHCACVACNVCGETALQSVREDTTDEGSSHSHTDAGSNSGIMSRQNSARNTPAKVDYFWFAPEHFPGMTKPPEKIWCGTHKNPNGSWKGFEGVSRLEQYAFLLHIALRRLYVHFRLHHSLQSGKLYRLLRNRMNRLLIKMQYETTACQAVQKVKSSG